MTFTIILEWDAEDRVYNVSVPALPGCYTWGRTKAQAIASAREAVALFVEDMTARGESPPVESELRRIRIS